MKINKHENILAALYSSRSLESLSCFSHIFQFAICVEVQKCAATHSPSLEKELCTDVCARSDVICSYVLLTQSKKEIEPVNLLQKNDGNHHQSTTGRSEKSAETIETEKAPAVTSAEQKRGKPDRGLKRGMKGKQVENPESAGEKAAEPKSKDKVDPVNEPSAKRTTRPSKNTPPVAPCVAKESQSKPAVNGKAQASANSSAATSSSNAKENRTQPQGKGQGCQTSQKEKGSERRSKSNAQVSVYTCKNVCVK